MFVAASTRCFADRTFTEACTALTDLQFDRLEIWLDGAGHLNPAEIADDPEGFQRAYREATRITPVAFSFADRIDQAQFEGICKSAKLLKIAQLSVPAAPLGTPFNEEVDRLRELVAIAGEDGIRVSIKTQPGLLSEDPHTVVEICQAVPGLGITLDPSCFLLRGTREEDSDAIYPHTYHVHLRDTSRDKLQVQVGLGEVDYNRIITQLRRQNYTGALVVELLPEYVEGETRDLELRKLRMLLESQL